jgi:hypothetical protein
LFQGADSPDDKGELRIWFLENTETASRVQPSSVLPIGRGGFGSKNSHYLVVYSTKFDNMPNPSS